MVRVTAVSRGPVGWAALALLTAVAIGCGAGGTATPTTVPIPGIEAADCRFEIPKGRSVECGYLTVQADRAQPGGRTIRLHYAVFSSEADDPEPDPVVYLAGGPGSSALGRISFSSDQFFAPLIAARDLVVFDQRGTGFSEPSLNCPEYLDMVHRNLNTSLTVEEEAEQVTVALAECRERLSRVGIDVAAYNSAENAADLNDLRVKLGYDKWNLFGISYGTKLALTAMRDYPEGIRSAVLDSTYPLEVDGYVTRLPHVDGALDLLFRACASQRPCDMAYPDLGGALFDLARDLDESPARYVLTNPFTDERYLTALNGDGFIGFVFQSLYVTDLVRVLPALIDDVRRGELDGLKAIQAHFLADLDLSSIGMHYSVQCVEEAPFTSAEALESSALQYPELQGLSDREPILDICELWRTTSAGPAENQAVLSDIPALVLAGEYDPITPPRWGRAVAANLANGYFFEFPGVGHGASISGDCPLGIMLAFLDSPEKSPDASCIAGMEGPVFLVR